MERSVVSETDVSRSFIGGSLFVNACVAVAWKRGVLTRDKTGREGGSEEMGLEIKGRLKSARKLWRLRILKLN